MKIYIPLFSLLMFLTACNHKSSQEQRASSKYFDLKAYFEQESVRLNAKNPPVDKVVTVNNSSEQKSLKIPDWTKELSVFIDADINKTAWQGLFKVRKEKNEETYSSEEEKVPVKKVEIIRNNNKITSIQIFIKNENVLYTSLDTLSYYPDSLYKINKTQRIRFLSEKKYQITGKF